MIFAHLARAIADLPDILVDELFAFLQGAKPTGSRRFAAEYDQLSAKRRNETPEILTDILLISLIQPHWRARNLHLQWGVANVSDSCPALLC